MQETESLAPLLHHKTNHPAADAGVIIHTHTAVVNISCCSQSYGARDEEMGVKVKVGWAVIVERRPSKEERLGRHETKERGMSKQRRQKNETRRRGYSEAGVGIQTI